MMGAGFRTFIFLMGGYFLVCGLYVSLYLFYQWLSSRRRKRDPVRSLAFRMLEEECDFFHRSYRELAFNDPEHTKLPLNPASWPAFDSHTPWSYTHVSLCRLRSHFTWFVNVAKVSFREMGWNDYVEIFDLPEGSTLMVNLLEALKKFQDVLESKVELVEQSK